MRIENSYSAITQEELYSGTFVIIVDGKCYPKGWKNDGVKRFCSMGHYVKGEKATLFGSDTIFHIQDDIQKI